MSKLMRRNVGKKKPDKPDHKEKTIELLEDMNQTLNEILELLQNELEEEPEPKQQPSTVGGPP